jgi:hypothetical protein
MNGVFGGRFVEGVFAFTGFFVAAFFAAAFAFDVVFLLAVFLTAMILFPFYFCAKFRCFFAIHFPQHTCL